MSSDSQGAICTLLAFFMVVAYFWYVVSPSHHDTSANLNTEPKAQEIDYAYQREVRRYALSTMARCRNSTERTQCLFETTNNKLGWSGWFLSNTATLKQDRFYFYSNLKTYLVAICYVPEGSADTDIHPDGSCENLSVIGGGDIQRTS